MSTSWSNWTRRPSSSLDPSEIFERPLGFTEAGFYWDSVFNRTADIIRHAHVQLQSPSLVSPSNVTRAWTTLKQRYPLLAATTDDRSSDGIFFVVNTSRITSITQTELQFASIRSLKEVDARIDGLLNGHESPLSNNLLACLIVLHDEVNSNEAHVLIHSAHSISDEVAHHTLLGEFLHSLCDPTSSDTPVVLSERLALATAIEMLNPRTGLSVSRQRWRNTTARLIMMSRRAGMKGGQTLPRHITEETGHSPAHSRSTSHVFTEDETKVFLQSCRISNVTFGSVLPMLGQLALGRLFCKYYLKGEMTHDEWEFRKTEPMINAGPLNIRSFLDTSWQKAGGNVNVSLGIGFYIYQLTTIPLGAAANCSQGDEVPSYLEMLPKSRFFSNANRMKQTMTSFMQHPLFFEMNHASLSPRLDRMRRLVEKWQNQSHKDTVQAPSISAKEQATKSDFYIFNFGGATLGNLDGVVPSEYFSPQTAGPESHPDIKVVAMRSFLHCRPMELYLGASTFLKRLKFYIFWDGNVYDGDVVEDWLQELVEATKVYLT